MLRFCVRFAHLHHSHQHFIYFVARKTSKFDIEYTLWGRRRLGQQGFPRWRAPPIFVDTSNTVTLNKRSICRKLHVRSYQYPDSSPLTPLRMNSFRAVYTVGIDNFESVFVKTFTTTKREDIQSTGDLIYMCVISSYFVRFGSKYGFTDIYQKL